MSSPKSATNAGLKSPLPATAARVRRKAQPDLYTVLLTLSVIAIGIAITFLWLAMKPYKYKIKVDVPTVSAIDCRMLDAVAPFDAALFS